MLQLTIWCDPIYDATKSTITHGVELIHYEGWSNVELTGKWKTKITKSDNKTICDLSIQFRFTECEWSWKKFRYIDKKYTQYVDSCYLTFLPEMIT